MCGACKMTGCIDPSGNVFPCAFLQDTPFCGGNLREKSFKDIWDNAPAFHRFRALEPAACRLCSRFEKCRGGCPAVAYFVTRDLNTADPECLVNWSRDISSAPLIK
jgi:radical SAM protein with 4Fe4S-binding SPASM domain